MKKTLLVLIIGLLLVASVSAFSFFQKQESKDVDYKPQILSLLNDRHEDFIMYADAFGVDSACLYVGNQKYTITRDSISDDCGIFHMYSVSISPDVLNLRTNEEFIDAFAKEKIVPSKSSWTAVMIKCGFSNIC